MSFLGKLNYWLENGWWSRMMMVTLFWIAIDITAWSQAFASTALAIPGKDLLAVAGIIAAVSAAPLGLLTLSLNTYMNMRASKSVVINDRRKEEQ